MSQKPAEEHMQSDALAVVGEQERATGSTARRPGGLRVLIIDDEPEIQRAVGTYLTGLHFHVESALTASEGMDLVARWHPDVVILDLTLPDMDGLEVCRQLRPRSEGPINVLSVQARSWRHTSRPSISSRVRSRIDRKSTRLNSSPTVK